MFLIYFKIDAAFLWIPPVIIYKVEEFIKFSEYIIIQTERLQICKVEGWFSLTVDLCTDDMVSRCL